MRSSLPRLLLLLGLVTAMGCDGILRLGGTMEPDAVDAPDATDTWLDTDLTDPVDPPTDTSAEDLTEVDAGCVSDSECDDGEACNGQETCGPVGLCVDGTPLEDGTECTTATGDEGVCASGLCRPPGCGDGVPDGDEECDDGNYINGDGCEANCLFTCHEDAECDDSDQCTDESCEPGGNGQICSITYHTRGCDDSDPCTHTDECDGAGTCSGTGYTCTAGECEATSECDGSGGCTVTFQAPGSTCDDSDPCTHTDECDDAGTCSGTGYSCAAGPCEATSECDGSGGCTVTFEAPGTTCNDGDPCTHTDDCDAAGTCAGTGYTCTAGACQVSTCDGDGGCDVSLLPEGSGCDDSDPCTHTDRCGASGTCAGTGYTCTAAQCEATSECDGSGGCTVTFETPGTTCNDGDPCTHTDRCNSTGICAGTGYVCLPGTCEVSTCDGEGGCDVTAAAPGTSCNDTNPCTHTDVCDASGGCAGTDYVCVPGVCEAASSCDGDGGCDVTPEATGVPCNDLDPCTHSDECDGAATCGGTEYTCTAGQCEANSECDGDGGCIVTFSGSGTPCDDSDPCTHTDDCDSAGNCFGTGYTCTPGMCEADSTCDGDGSCTATPAAPGTPCEDGLGCTTDDVCDGAGACGGTPDDGLCSGGEVCRPRCFPTTGCGLPPDSLVVDCTDQVVLPADASCSIQLDSLAGQVGCLSCSAEVGTVVLANDSFEDPAGGCTTGNWWLSSGDICFDDVDGCAPRNTVSCCASVSSLFEVVGGDCRLRSERDDNCGGGHDEWQLSRGFDTRGLTDLRICFRVAEDSATSDEGVLLYASDASRIPEQVFCLEGVPVSGSTGVDHMEWPYCVALPAWAENNPGLFLTFIVHSNDNNQAEYLDDILLVGWTAGCTPTRAEAFREDFEPCPATNPIPDGWNGWSVTVHGGAGPRCTDVCSTGTPGGARADDGQWTMVHTVDTSALDGDVNLCFDVGDDHSDWNERITVSFDSDNGAGWQQAWYWENEWGTDGGCRRVCLPLSAQDPHVARNPALRIALTLESNQSGERVHVDDIVVEGAQHCDAGARVSIGSIRDDGGGSYTFGLADDADLPLGVQTTCSWDSPPVPVQGWDSTWFKSP